MTTATEKIATTYLESGSVNWQVGIELHNNLILDNPLLAKACLKRSVEIKPTLVKRLKLKDDELRLISERHSLVALDDAVANRLGNYFKVPFINTMETLDLEIFQILSTETKRFSIKKILKSEKVFGFGSCFAINFINYLHKLDLNACSSVISEDINCPINNLLLLKWVFKNEECSLINELKEFNPDIDRLDLLKNFKDANHIVLTLGASFFLIKNQVTMEITLKPSSITKYTFQNINSLKQSITQIVELIKSINSRANIIISVSPIPLKATLDGRDPVSTNIVSKSALRAAIEELLIENKLPFTYLPIYDAVIGLSPYMGMAAFGTDDGNSRHLNGEIINSIMRQIADLIIEA
jgi:hypothetical protein